LLQLSRNNDYIHVLVRTRTTFDYIVSLFNPHYNDARYPFSKANMFNVELDKPILVKPRLGRIVSIEREYKVNHYESLNNAMVHVHYGIYNVNFINHIIRDYKPPTECFQHMMHGNNKQKTEPRPYVTLVYIDQDFIKNQQNKNSLMYQFMMKRMYSSLGMGVIIVDNSDGLVATSAAENLLYQNSHGNNYSIILCGEQETSHVVGIMSDTPIKRTIFHYSVFCDTDDTQKWTESLEHYTNVKISCYT
jgi:hypothetical protein